MFSGHLVALHWCTRSSF